MFNKELDSYGIMERVLRAIMHTPLTHYSIIYRIKTTRAKKALETLELSNCVILLCKHYHITDKGRELLTKLEILNTYWSDGRK